ncbi:MAG: TldD/PmbA family protein [Candidatus Eisenbacteria bacterium]|nr:TldD/PmbA family protein [Candidatus Eisenbacteria bacterium]
MLDKLEERFRRVAPKADFCSLRFVEEKTQTLSVRQNVVQPATSAVDIGVMITVVEGSGMGYAGTSDLSEDGLRRAADQAHQWARRTAGRTVVDFAKVPMPRPEGEYRSPVRTPWESISLAEKIEILRAESASIAVDPRIVDWEASLSQVELETLFLTADGGRAVQRFSYLIPYMSATANQGAETQTRSLGGRGLCRQGGLEVLDAIHYRNSGPRLAAEALELLTAPNCPSGQMDVILAPDQMILQIHESIGHPLELDRILGDERNYAGTSFVTMDMFGSYRYGSDLLNITYDPTRSEQFASYGFDDDGLKAERQFIIRNGILERPLGGITSQARAGVEGVANSRATSWNRPPIDRMANLNLEPGTSSLEEMIAAVERGIFMRTNVSWSIDDSRNKFQFGCEWGQLIENGKLTQVVKKPNYRGISATFWRNLKMVGRESTFEVLGTPNCGKGEPNQVIRVGHASPTCLFTQVDVFGGE